MAQAPLGIRVAQVAALVVILTCVMAILVGILALCFAILTGLVQ